MGFEFVIEQQMPDPVQIPEKPSMHEQHKRLTMPTIGQPVTRKKLDEQLNVPEEDMAGPSLALFVQEPEQAAEESSDSDADLRDY